MLRKDQEKDPASKTGIKPPRPYQLYIIAAIVIVMVVLYVVMYW